MKQEVISSDAREVKLPAKSEYTITNTDKEKDVEVYTHEGKLLRSIAPGETVMMQSVWVVKKDGLTKRIWQIVTRALGTSQ